MTRKQFLASPLLAAGAAAAAEGPAKTPSRINRAIELLEADQMIYYTCLLYTSPSPRDS